MCEENEPLKLHEAIAAKKILVFEPQQQLEVRRSAQVQDKVVKTKIPGQVVRILNNGRNIEPNLQSHTSASSTGIQTHYIYSSKCTECLSEVDQTPRKVQVLYFTTFSLKIPYVVTSSDHLHQPNEMLQATSEPRAGLFPNVVLQSKNNDPDPKGQVRIIYFI